MHQSYTADLFYLNKWISTDLSQFLCVFILVLAFVLLVLLQIIPDKLVVIIIRALKTLNTQRHKQWSHIHLINFKCKYICAIMVRMTPSFGMQD